MANDKRWMKDIIATVEKEGGKVKSVEFGSKSHLKVRFDTPLGERMIVCSATPSCPFTLQHVRADVRRRMRGH